jgi:hypothetical protein
MLKIDNYYKVIASTFGIAYIIGIIIAFIYVYRGNIIITESTNIIQNFSLTSNIYFKQTIYDIFYNALNLFLIPFSYFSFAIQHSYIHINLLTSSFLGQIKLLVLLIPQFLFFITYIIFSTLGIKFALLIIKLFLNNFIIKENNYKIKEKFFSKDDITIFYIGLLLIAIGAVIQTQIIKNLFLFFVNLKSIAYILIILLYLLIIIISITITIKIIKEYLKKYKK